MDKEESFRNSTCEGQINMAERELSAFIRAVTELFGPEHARLSTEDWLDESELMDTRLEPRVQIGERSQWQPRLDSQIGRLQREIIEYLRHRSIRRFRRYYRPIVSHPRF